MCMESRPSCFQMELLGIFHRILKSITFNVSMLVIGFLIGIGICMYAVHKNATKNSKYECVQKLNEKLEEFQELDRRFDKVQVEIGDLITEMKQKLSHDEYNFDNLLKK